MIDFVEDVREFHKRFKHPCPPVRQTKLSKSVAGLRRELITSEFLEVKAELHSEPGAPNIKNLAKELADLIYVLAGTLVVLGELGGTDHGVDYQHSAIISSKYDHPMLNMDFVLAAHTSRVRAALDEPDSPKSLAQLAGRIHDYIRFCTSIMHYYKMPVEAVWKEVHKSNLSKLWSDGKPRYYKSGPKKGKVRKPPAYKKANMDKVFAGKKAKRV